MISRIRFSLRHIALFVAAVVVTVTLVAAISRAEAPAGVAPARPALAPDAPAPPVITYQGRLLDPTTGQPKPDGSYMILFGLYSVETGGTAMWEEKQSVQVSNGLLSVTLGNQTGNSIDPAMFDGYPRWLSVIVSGDGELLPRIRVASAPYAMWSNLAQNAGNADRLGGSLPATYHDAALLTGTVSPLLFSAFKDLTDEGYLGNASGDLASNNGTVQTDLNADKLDNAHANAFSLTSHNHDSTYVNVTGDNMSGTLTVLVPSTGSHGISSRTDSTASGAAAVEAKNYGAGYGLNAYSESSWAVVAQSNGSNPAVGAVNKSTGEAVDAYSAASHAVDAEAAGSSPAIRAVNSGTGNGLYASAKASHAILAVTDSTVNGNAAVAGLAQADSKPNTVMGIKGQCSYGSCYAGYFIGPVYVSGLLTKAGGGFTIDHPLDPQNKTLNHSFVESPDMMNVYNGNVVLDAEGNAWVDLPAWFETLNRDFRYQLTPIGAPGPNLYIAQKVQKNRFQIAGGSPGLEVSWQVTGIRQDPFANAHRMPVEQNKPVDQQGTYLNPDAYGLPENRNPYYEEAGAQPVVEPQKP